ncbi:hypothetical protein ACLOJK_004543 [Asimina triloba]
MDLMDLVDGAAGVFQDLLLDRSRWEKLLARGDVAEGRDGAIAGGDGSGVAGDFGRMDGKMKL